MARRVALLVPLVLLALATTSPAATRTYSSHQLHAAIPDRGTVVRTIDVPDTGPVSFLAVGVRIRHPRDADLTVNLVGPSGRTVVLSSHEGGSGHDYGSGAAGCSGNLAWFESDALDPVSTQTAPFAGEQRPEQPLTRLYGGQARGRWSLQVADGAAGAAGTLLCWQLEISRNVRTHVRVSSGGVAADLSFVERHSYDTRLAVAIRRHGVLTLAAPLSRFVCRDCPASGLDTVFDDPLHVVDLDADGEPEVLVDLFTGGAHCCFFTVIFRYVGRGYHSTVAFWGDPGYRLQDLDGSGRPELVTADDRFAYAFTAYAFSVLPLRIEHYDHGRLLDVTSQYPWLVRRQARGLWSEYQHERSQRDGDVRGLLAAWLADEYRLGRSEEAWTQIEAASGRGELSAPRVDPMWPSGRRYLTALRAFLVKTGYAA